MKSSSRPNAEQYSGKVTPVGNSKGIRLEAAFFKAHPEFNGVVRATVLADGQVLLSAQGATRRSRDDDDADPVMLGFLQFLEKQMVSHPDLIEPADRDQLVRIGKLVEGVSLDDIHSDSNSDADDFDYEMTDEAGQMIHATEPNESN